MRKYFIGALVLILVGAVDCGVWYINGYKKLAGATTYEECVKNGGRSLNSEFNACLGAKDELFLQYSAQNLPRINERTLSERENLVAFSGAYSADLVKFLRNDYTGCEVGYYKIIEEVPGRFALLNYGCADDENALGGAYYIIAMKLGDRWALISPTNHMNDNGMPSCLLADIFKVSGDLASECFENTGYSDGSVRPVNYP
jgi:hypothetical protein